jgi:coenzyme F420-reducing hydrogenase alpha subunit
MVKIKSRDISPDGALGGKGYIQKIPDMRRQLMNCVEVLSALSDTIYDELKAPHWDPAEDKLDARDREEVKEIVENAEDIKEDPEGWAREEEAEEDADNGIGKKASPRGVLMARLQASSGALTALLSSNLRVASTEQGALLQDLRQFTALTQEVLENYDV